MALTPRTRLGPYEILSALGAGGMGEVYRVRDTKLNRDVALKVLPDSFANDPDRLARFQREAQVLASLNHPNIAHIHGLEESGGVRALIMELVEGEDLSQRIARGPIPIDEALPIARQIAEALEAAHEQGIIHRDLKPANIKVREDGTVKVLDFGLAKLSESAGGGQLAAGGASLSPTITSPALMTGVGMLLGTAAYMSPEQAKGKDADRTSDVWAFGCVLYEMLAGRAVFQGETVSEILAGILRQEPDWDRLPAETPESIRRLLRRCLSKDRKLRLQHLGDVRLEIDESWTTTVPRPVPRRGERLGWITALAFVAAVAGFLAVRVFRSVPAPQEMRLEINTPPTSDALSFSISPDGRNIVFVVTSDGRPRLWLRSLDSVSAQALAGTDGATFPFWSPDSRAVGFFADSSLKRIDINGGSVQILAKAPLPRGGTWNRDGTIVFGPAATGPLFRVRATGGEPSAVTRVAPRQLNHRYPQFLPDGQHFLYYVTGNSDVRGIYLGELDALAPRRLLDADTAGVYASSGQLLFVRQSTLFAQDFDAVRLALTADPFVVAQQVAQGGAGEAPNFAALSTSAAGLIAYRTGGSGRRQLAWFDRSGKELGKVGDPDTTYGPSLSPDGRRLALSRTVNGNTDIWLLELERGVFGRLTFDAAIDSYPVWSPDGSRVVFQTGRSGNQDLYEKPLNTAESEAPLLANAQSKLPYDWSPDGRFLLYRDIDSKMGWDLWALPMAGDRKAFLVAQTEFDERDAQFSPDGKWIAYQSNETGRFEVYVQPFPGPGPRTQISTNGGAQVRWRPDGKELFYVALNERLMAVPIRTTSDGKTIDSDAPVPLFATRVGGAVQLTYRPQYMVSPDGQRFLMSIVAEEAATPITVILNWNPRLKE